MKKIVPILIVTALLFVSCEEEKHPALTAFEVYCEIVANDAKPISFHHPMESSEIDELWSDLTAIAAQFQVELYREDDLPESLLFSNEASKGKTVVIVHKDDRLEQYLQWKADAGSYTKNDFKTNEALARRLGRLLGYSPQGINGLLRKNSKYRDLHSFGIKEQITHLYYEDLQSATDFYQKTLGLHLLKNNLFQISKDGFIALHAFDETHTFEQPKSTAIALLTDQLPKWYAHIQRNDIPIKYTYKPKEGGAHDGFVAVDPGGYLLEFEEFKQHPENELFMATLSKSPKMDTNLDGLNFFGTITWTYHNDLLKMQKFYEEVLGYRLVADQGWTKIYHTTNSSFIGLVDERRGMEDYADEKAVEIEWTISKHDTLREYSRNHWKNYPIERDIVIGPENYRYRLSP